MLKECSRCGKCCFFPIGKENEMKPCRHLIKSQDGTYLCRIYSRRLGAFCGFSLSGQKFYCIAYNTLGFEIFGCPLNLGNKKQISIIFDGEKVLFFPCGV